MKRTKAAPLGYLVGQYLHEEGLEGPLEEYRLLEAWPKVAGEKAARLTTATSLHGQTLTVRLSSPALRTELSMRRRQLVAELNQAAGAQVITDIRFL